MPVDSQGGMVKICSWNPGRGASSRDLPAEFEEEVRDELRAMGCVTWITRGPVIRYDCALEP